MIGDRQPDQIERLAPLVIVAAFAVIVFLTISPFLPAIIWGAVVAISIDPWFRWLVRKLGGHRLLAAWIAGLLLAAIVVIPALGLAVAMLNLVPSLLSWTGRLAEISPAEPPAIFSDLPAIGPEIQAFWHDLMTDASQALSTFKDEIRTAIVWLLGEAEVFGIFVGEFAIGILLAIVLCAIPAQAEWFQFKGEHVYTLDPPGKYLHPYEGALSVESAPESELKRMCQSVLSSDDTMIFGCSTVGLGWCDIKIRDDLYPTHWVSTYNHEIAHCNGWVHD